MLFGTNQPMWFYQHPIDFRKQIDGLVILVADKLERDPTSGQLFIFRNRQANKLKFLWWDKNGFWLCYRRLEKGRFKLPKPDDTTLNLCKEQLHVLLAGLDFTQKGYLGTVTATCFY
jgi:transposase